MKLVIREYLAMLRESGELDVLLPDLLSVMGFEAISLPQRGVRQYGVDAAFVGTDPEDGQRKLLLTTIKQGDIGRAVWDGTPQALRSTLDEILDSYVRHSVRPQHETLPRKIVVVTNGKLLQEVESNWAGYIHRNSTANIEFCLWGGDTLTAMIAHYLLDEYLFPASAQQQLRKTLAFVDGNDIEPTFFYDFVRETLFDRALELSASASNRRSHLRALKLINLGLMVVFAWGREQGNLRTPFLCAERAILTVWDWIRAGALFESEGVVGEFGRLFRSYIEIGYALASKLSAHCRTVDGLFGFGNDEVDYPIRTFEFIGVLGSIACTLSWFTTITEEAQSAAADDVGELLGSMIRKNSAASSPVFDEHGIDLTIALLAMLGLHREEEAKAWLIALSNRVLFAYQLGQRFPISSDSYEDLLAQLVGEAPPKEELTNVSTLLPSLAVWLATLKLDEQYEKFVRGVSELFPHTNLQIWYPDEGTEEKLYRSNAGVETGSSFCSIHLPLSPGDLKETLHRVHTARPEWTDLSCFRYGFPILAVISSRHFRTPVLPCLWANLSGDTEQEEQ